MTGFVSADRYDDYVMSADRYDDYVMQLKTHRQKSHYKSNQLCECATINPKVNSVIDGKRALFSG